jgi:glutaredoxin
MHIDPIEKNLQPSGLQQPANRTLRLSGVMSAGLFVLAMAALSPTANAQTVFRIVGPDGRVTFSDKPPLTAEQSVTATGRGGRPVEVANTSLPFELRQVSTRYPVTLYSSASCGPCTSGRALLTSRGIPFTERTVTTAEDGDALARLSGENSLPFLTIGGQKIKGFSDTEWTQFLDAAGYPAASRLPANFRNPPASPLVAVQRPAPAEQPAATAAASADASPNAAAPAPSTPVNNASNPAGIRF